MKYFSVHTNASGMALVLLIFIMLIAALISVVALSLLSQGVMSGLWSSDSVEAFAIAVGGKEWYLQQLAGDTDWSNESSQTDIPLGSGTFDITINSTSSKTVDFTVTGKVSGYHNQITQREVSIIADRKPKAAKFAIFWQQDGPGTRLNFNNSGSGTDVSGDFWSVGSSRINSSSEVTNGLVYYGQGEAVTGSGSYSTQAVAPPFPAMPAVNTATYDTLMADYDSDISGNGNPWQSGTINLTGNTLRFQDFRTRNNLVITGYGRIVASRDVLLHYTGGSGAQSLTITPQGGTGIIEIIAGRNFRINTNGGNRSVTINPGVRMYARNAPGTNKLFDIRESSTTSISGALIMARRRLFVRNGASITNSTLYLDYANSATRNRLQIQGSGTTVTGTAISQGRDNNLALAIRSGASFTGLAYQYGSATQGRARVDGNATITGALLVRQFRNTTLGPATITYNESAMLAAMPDGFPGAATMRAESWDDN